MERAGYTPEEAIVPEPLPVMFDRIPEALREYNQWVVWKYMLVDEEIKKPPYSPRTGRLASVRTPSTWGSFQDARSTYETGQFSGVGIVLTADMGIVAIDIDYCVADGHINTKAQQVISRINSYTELSPSSTGIRMMLEGKLPAGLRRRGKIEMYEDLRYVTLTGQRVAETPQRVEKRYQELYSLYHRVFALERKQKENTGVGGEHHPTYQIARSDQEVLHKALTAKNSGNFKRYYYGDSSLWEGAGTKHDSQSEADFTLVLMLLYWTNGDTTQVDRLFRHSGLYRQKWNRPIKGTQTYGERLIQDAINKSGR